MNKLKKSVFILFVSIFFIACQDRTYTQRYNGKIKHINLSSIKLECPYLDIQGVVKEAFKNQKVTINKDSLYRIKVDYLNYTKQCNNPMTSSYDATYDGFIRLTLFKDRKKIYMCQKDYHGDLDVNVVEELLDLMKDELE